MNRHPEDITIDEALKTTDFSRAMLEFLRAEPWWGACLSDRVVKILAWGTTATKPKTERVDGQLRTSWVPDKKVQKEFQQLREDIASRVLRDMRRAGPDGRTAGS